MRLPRSSLSGTLNQQELETTPTCYSFQLVQGRPSPENKMFIQGNELCDSFTYIIHILAPSLLCARYQNMQTQEMKESLSSKGLQHDFFLIP